MLDILKLILSKRKKKKTYMVKITRGWINDLEPLFQCLLQNYGPKCNFKKRKIKLGEFNGFPAFSEFVQRDKFPRVPLLSGYRTIEQCSLEYTTDRGASIEPHIDDCWVWGERVISVNLLSDSVSEKRTSASRAFSFCSLKVLMERQSFMLDYGCRYDASPFVKDGK